MIIKKANILNICFTDVTFSHLHIQFQDVCVSLQQLAQVGNRSAKVSVDKLFDVTVGGALRSFFVSLQVSDKIQGKIFY